MLSCRLYHVNETVPANAYDDDIDDMGAFTNTAAAVNTNNNYSFDHIGQLKKDKQEGIDDIEWTVYNKVKRITRKNGFSKIIGSQTVYPSDLEFHYDAGGNRVSKIEKIRDANGLRPFTEWKTTHYVRDAQGNQMAVYVQSTNAQTQTASFSLKERDLYGSSRIGLDVNELEMVGAPGVSAVTATHILANKLFEGSTQIGSVLCVFTDKKIPISSNNTIIDFYISDTPSYKIC